MRALLEPPRVEQRPKKRELDKPVVYRTGKKSFGRRLLGALQEAGKFALFCVLTAGTLAVQGFLYLMAVVSVPLFPMLQALFLLPVVLLFGLVIMGVAALGF